MADHRAHDGYEQYFAEKLWALVPSIHRQEDGLAEHPGTLRAFIELVAEQAALLRRGHDRLWDDAFIDLCDDWSVPYLGDLVGTRMVSALNRRARRVDVAKTIYYRRRKGTPRVLEELIADITGWEGKVVESFRFLGRFHHSLDPALAERAEPARGWADLRLPRLAESTGGPWDPFAHTADLRASRGEIGRWNLPKISFHLFRLTAVALDGVMPRALATPGHFTFDPSGRAVPLFMPRLRDAGAWDDWQSAQPWQVPAPMGCRILGHATYVIDESLRRALATAGMTAAAVASLGPVVGVRFGSEAALRAYLARQATAAELLAPGNFDRLRAGALVPDGGKHALWPAAVAVDAIPRHRVAAAALAGSPLAVADIDVVVDPAAGRFQLAAADPDAVRVRYHVGFGGPIGAGGQDRRATVIDAPEVVVPTASLLDATSLPVAPSGRVVGVTELPDSATYGVADDPDAIERWTVQAANFARPYVELAADWTVTAAAGLEATLVLDGLWLGTRGSADLVLRGAWSRVTIRACTLDPGGADADDTPLGAVALVVEGSIDELRLDHSIAAAVRVRAGGHVDALVIEDSIIAGALALPRTTATLRRVTVLAAVDVERLDASEALITGPVEVADVQAGCFRFSSAPPGSRLPHPYRAVEQPAGTCFVSTRFGDPGFAWLAASAPASLRRGAENGSELGAWSAALNPIKEDSLLGKIEEYLPFGLIPMLVRET